MEGVALTICCPRKEWETWQSFYAVPASNRIHIVHASGGELESYYQQADILGLVRGAEPYLDFAMPLKLFEALSYGLPIITSAETEAARLIVQEKFGWVVANAEEFRNLLRYLREHPQDIAEKRRAALAARERHTWLIRAQTVAEILTGLGRERAPR